MRTITSILAASAALAACATTAETAPPPMAAATPAPDLPCTEDPKFREQDFTVGHWDVYNGETKSAEVLMELVLADCAIHETWTTMGDRPGDGLGLFNYSRLLGDWGYYWVSETGAATSFRGGLVEPGNMLFVTERPLPDGGVRLRHWSLILQPDGRVRELSVGTEDGGATWTTEYDLMWVKKPDA
jgi:hypothetical protein